MSSAAPRLQSVRFCIHFLWKNMLLEPGSFGVSSVCFCIDVLRTSLLLEPGSSWSHVGPVTGEYLSRSLCWAVRKCCGKDGKTSIKFHIYTYTFILPFSIVCEREEISVASKSFTNMRYVHSFHQCIIYDILSIMICKNEPWRCWYFSGRPSSTSHFEVNPCSVRIRTSSHVHTRFWLLRRCDAVKMSK